MGVQALLRTPRYRGMWGLLRKEWEWRGEDWTTTAAGREDRGISCDSPWIKIRAREGGECQWAREVGQN